MLPPKPDDIGSLALCQGNYTNNDRWSLTTESYGRATSILVELHSSVDSPEAALNFFQYSCDSNYVDVCFAAWALSDRPVLALTRHTNRHLFFQVE